MKKILFLFIAVLFFDVSSAFSQYKVEGKITDIKTNEGLVGVHVVIPNINQGTISDINSHFVLESDKEIDSIIVSFIGYITQRIKIEQNNIDIRLEPSSVELEQVIVTANREEQLRKDAPLAITIINKNFIEEIKPISAADLLNKVSGVHIADFGNEQQSMSIRQPLSFSRTQLVILEDGVPIGPTSITTSSDLKEINMAAVKNVEVIRGPNSSLYGSEAIGGAINFLTQGPSLMPTGKLSIQASNLGYKSIDFSASTTFKKIGVFIGGTSAQRRNGYREDSDFDKNAISLRADYHINNTTKLTTSASYISFYTDSPGGLDSTTYFKNDKYSNCRFSDDKSNIFRVNTRLDKKWNDKSKTFFTLFYRNHTGQGIPSYYIKAYTYKPPVKYKGEYIKNDYQSLGLLMQHKQNFIFWNTQLIGGISVDYTPDNYTSEKLEVTKDVNNIYTEYEKTGIYVQDFYATLINTASYIHVETSPISKLKFLAALRYDRLDFAFDNHMPETDSIGAPDETNFFSHLSPKIGLMYNLKNNIGVYCNYSVGFAPPLFSHLYKEVIVPNLKPSTYFNYEIGGWMSFCKNKGYFDLSLFQSDGINEIVTVLLPDGSDQLQSIGKTKHKGIEYSFKYVLLKDITIRFVGSNSLHEFVKFVNSNKDYSGNEMNLAPQFIANAGITYKPSFIKNLHIGGEWQKVGDYYMDELNSEKYEGFQIFNIKTGYQFKGFDLWLHILNLTDEFYATRASKSYYGTKSTPSESYLPGAHRTFLVGVRYNFIGKKK